MLQACRQEDDYLQNHRQRPRQMRYNRVVDHDCCLFQRAWRLGERSDGALYKVHLVIQLLSREPPTSL